MSGNADTTDNLARAPDGNMENTDRSDVGFMLSGSTTDTPSVDSNALFQEASTGISTFDADINAQPTTVANTGAQPTTSFFGGFGASSASPVSTNMFTFGALVPNTKSERFGTPPPAATSVFSQSFSFASGFGGASQEASNNIPIFGNGIGEHPTTVPSTSVEMIGAQPAATSGFGGLGASSATADITGPIGSTGFTFGASVPNTGVGMIGAPPPAALSDSGGIVFGGGGTNVFTFGASVPEETKIAEPTVQAAGGSPDLMVSSASARSIGSDGCTLGATPVSAGAGAGGRRKIKATVAASSGTTSNVGEGFSFSTWTPQLAPTFVPVSCGTTSSVGGEGFSFGTLQPSSEPGLSQEEELSSAFFKAVEECDVEKVQTLVNKVDINAKGKDNETALVKAAAKGHEDIVKLLLTFNPDVNIPDVSTLEMISVHLIYYAFPLSH